MLPASSNSTKISASLLLWGRTSPRGACRSFLLSQGLARATPAWLRARQKGSGMKIGFPGSEWPDFVLAFKKKTPPHQQKAAACSHPQQHRAPWLTLRAELGSSSRSRQGGGVQMRLVAGQVEGLSLCRTCSSAPCIRKGMQHAGAVLSSSGLGCSSCGHSNA